MNKKILILLLSVLLTACANSTSSDIKAETEAVSETTTTTVTTTDDSEQTTTTTTQITVTSAKEKETDVTTNSVTLASNTTKTESTTTTAAQTSAAPRKSAPQTAAKSTAKPVTTTTAKKAVTTTTAANTASNNKPSGLTRLEDAVWELFTVQNHNNVLYRNIVRDELIKYGQAYCKSNPECFKHFTVNTKLYPYYDKNGKPLYAPCDMVGNVIAVGSDVEFPYDENLPCFSPYAETTQSARLAAVRSFISGMKLLIERVLCNALSHGIANMEWYITYGDEYCGIDWNVMAHIPDGDWIEFK